jgi:DUF1680 family protein
MRPDPRIDAIRSCVALERGPLVYCVESEGTKDVALDELVVPIDASAYREQHLDISGEPVVALSGPAKRRTVTTGAVLPYEDVGAAKELSVREAADVTAVPYFTWANRGEAHMRVWLPASDQ